MEEIAIIGMAGRFAEADNIQQFYQNLRAGRDSVRAISRTRIANTSLKFDRQYQVAGYIENVDLFDHKFFGISYGEASAMDPHQRLALELAFETFENAGYNPDHFNGSRTAVFGSQTFQKYYQLADRHDATLFTGNMNAAIVGRVSRFFNLRGSAMVIDTTCSSSLMALHYGCKELLNGDAECVLVCSVSLNLFPDMLSNDYDYIGINSADGKARAFSADANGTGSGEAAVCVLLKPLKKAIADGDIIHAVIKGSAVNQDANLSGSLTAPSGIAQSEVIKMAWEKTGVDPETITYIETHGTGTKLGDPIEAKGLDLAFKSFTNKTKFCAISSVKTNLGHTDTAAGLSGLIKVVLSLKHKELFPSLHFSAPNPFIDFDRSAVYVNDRLQKWEGSNGIRRAGISSFGLSGTNVHVVLEEAPMVKTPECSEQPSIVTISGKNSNALQQYAQRLHDFIAAQDKLLTEDITYTLNTGRKHFAFRYAAVVSGKEGLLRAMKLGATRAQTSPIVDRDLVFLFSNTSNVTRELIDGYANSYPLFGETYSKFLPYLKNVKESLTVHQLIFQYCFFQVLSQRGIKSKKFIGDGAGEITISLITGELGIEQAVEKAAALPLSDKAATTKKCEKILNRFSDSSILLAEVGLPGNISEMLVAMPAKQNILEVIFLDSSKSSSLLHYVKDLYEGGYDVDWATFHKDNSASRISLPSYPFERTRCWFHPPVNDYIKDWFYDVHWRSQPLATAVSIPNGKCYLVIADKGPLADQVIANIRQQGNSCIKVCYGDNFSRNGENFCVRRDHETDFATLVSILQSGDVVIDGVIDLSHCTIEKLEPEAKQASGLLMSQFSLLQSLSRHFTTRDFVVTIVGYHLHKVIERDDLINVIGNATTGFLKSTLADYPMVRATGIDLDASVITSVAASSILNEIFSNGPVRFVAYRGEKRYVPSLEKVDTSAHYEPGDAPVYLVTGGAGGIGRELCKSLAQKKKSTFILIGQTPMPAAIEYESIVNDSRHPQYEKVKFLSALQATGSTIEYYAGDVGNENAVGQIFTSIAASHPKIDGIIHLAGMSAFDQDLTSKDKTVVERTFAAKVSGTILLQQYGARLKPDFFVMFSSLNSLFPKKHSFEYAAASAFQDAFATQLRMKGQRVIAINWPGWYQINTNRKVPTRSDFDDFTLKPISTDDGMEALCYALASGKSNCVIADIVSSKFKPEPFMHFQNNASKGTRMADENLSLPASTTPDAEDDIQSKVLTIWMDVLKSPQIGLDDDFFEIGGHSLNGAQVINRIEAEFGISLSIDDLLEYATINQLTEFIESKSEKPVTRETPGGIAPIEEQQYYDLAPAQNIFWFHNQFKEGAAAYLMNSIYEVDGNLDIECLRKALCALADRHESLRTTFISVNGIPKQAIIPQEEYHPEVLYEDLRNSVNPETRLIHLALNSNLFFNLAKPPHQIKVQQLSETKFLFSLAIHHILSDGWSLRILFAELMEFYAGHRAGSKPGLAPLGIQYKDYTAWINERVANGTLTGERDYWRGKLHGTLPQFTIFPDQGSNSKKTYRSSKFNFAHKPEQIDALKALANQQNVTVFMLVVALWKVVFYKYSRQEDSILSTTIFGRVHQCFEPLLGNFLNTLVLRDSISGEESFANFLGKVKGTTLDAYANQSYPFDQLIDELPIRRGPAMSSLFNVGIVWHNYNLGANEESTGVIHGLTFKPLEKEGDGLIFDILINGSEQMNNFSLEYNTDRFFSTTIEKLAENFAAIAELVTKDPMRHLEGVIHESLTGEEKRILESLNKDSLNVLNDDFAFLEKPVVK